MQNKIENSNSTAKNTPYLHFLEKLTILIFFQDFTVSNPNTKIRVNVRMTAEQNKNLIENLEYIEFFHKIMQNGSK